jgi:nicotinamide phosphoribosyltransferase
MFKINPLYLTDAYKVGHQKMLAPGTTKLYGTWIPRSTKHAPKGITKIVSFGQQMTWKYIHDVFEEYFFSNNTKNLHVSDGYPSRDKVKYKALQFVKDMSLMLGMEYNGKHFEELWDLGYLPLKVKSLPEGIETNPNIPHMTFVNTVNGYAWLTLFMETMVSNLAWKPSTAATIAKLYRRQCTEWVKKTDPNNLWLVDYMCHDFSARGLSGPFDMIAVGLGHATSFRGSDTLAAIPAARYYYGEPDNESIINSVNASEHSVSCTKIFTVGEQQMITDWLKIFPKGILSIVADTFDLWKLITEYLPANKEAIMARDGKLVIRPDSGNPVDIICGVKEFREVKVNSEGRKIYQKVIPKEHSNEYKTIKFEETKGVIELLWDIFGGTINEQGYKVLDSHIGAIYGDSITPERQVQIYERLAAKGFAATNIVLGVGSFTYQFNTRDTLGFAAKGAWFEVEENIKSNTVLEAGFNHDGGLKTKTAYNIYKDPVTDDGTKKSLKGLLQVQDVSSAGDYQYADIKVFTECTPEQEAVGLLQVIYENGKFYNTTTFKEIRERLKQI